MTDIRESYGRFRKRLTDLMFEERDVFFLYSTDLIMVIAVNDSLHEELEND